MILLFVLRSLRAEYNMLQWHKTAQKNAIKSLEAQHIHTHTHTQGHICKRTRFFLLLTILTSVAIRRSVLFFMWLSNCVIKCKQSKFPRYSELKDTRAWKVCVCDGTILKRRRIKLHNQENYNLIRQFWFGWGSFAKPNKIKPENHETVNFMTERMV